MSTVAPPSKPVNPVLVDSEHYIDEQIRRTRRSLKLVDLAAGVITLLIGLLGFVLTAAVIDHWVVPGGLNTVGRVALFMAFLAGAAWYGWRQFIPLLRPINPVYAAQTIERGAPTLKNSLLNLLLFRSHRVGMSARVYHALEQQTALRLSSTPVDNSIDHAGLLRLGWMLLLIVAVAAAYAVFSPKDVIASAGRVLAPWADIAPPSRVKILDIKPGEVSVARGERVPISAEIHGLREDERVRVRFASVDERMDDAISMAPAEAGNRYEATLPRSGEGPAAESGVMQDMYYWIEAGDARSNRFRLSVFNRPTIIVQKVRYEYPAYTGFPSKDVDSTGDIRGIEGTKVTISALASQAIKTAWIDFNADGTNDQKMIVDGDRATATFTLALRDDRRTPLHSRYMLRFTSRENRTNSDPPVYRIEVTPDYAPEISITQPEEPERTVKVDEPVVIGVEARDPDFALSKVRLVGKAGDRDVEIASLLGENRETRVKRDVQFTPVDAGLKPGDVLEYWAEALDNKFPEPNEERTERRRLKIAGPADQPKNGKQQPGGQGQQGQKGQERQQGDQNGQGQPNGQGQEGDQQGQQGEGGQQGNQGENQQGQNGEGQGQPQGGNAGGQGQQNGQQQQGQSGGGQAGENNGQGQDAQQQSAQGGAGGTNQGGQQNQQQNPQNGNASGGGSSSGENQQQQQGAAQPRGGQQQNGQMKPGDASADGQRPEQQGQPQAGGQQGERQQGQPQDGGQQGQPQQGQGQQPEGAQQQGGQQQDGQQQQQQPGQGGGQQQDKVSSDGSDDRSAFEKISDFLKGKQGEQQQGNDQQQQTDNQQQGNGQQQQQGNAQQQQQGDRQQPAEQQLQGNQDQAGDAQQGGRQQSGEQAQQRPDGKQGQPGQAGGDPQAQQEGAKGSQQQRQNAGGAQQPSAGESQPDKPSGAAGQSEQQSQQKPPADGAPGEQVRENATEAQQRTAAGDNPSQRQGADTPRETQNGDGNPGQQPGAKEPSPDSGMNRNDGNAGSGHSTDQQEGSPADESSFKEGRQKDDVDNREAMNDQEPPGGSPDKKESNSRGGKSGEQSGGGQEGGGQKADAQGKGDPGQHEAADDGAGRADEQGRGETGRSAGREQVADGKTGESSGDQTGAGTDQRETSEDRGQARSADEQQGESRQREDQSQNGERRSPADGQQEQSPQPGGQQEPQASPQKQGEPSQQNQSGQDQSGQEGGQQAPQGEPGQPQQQPGQRSDQQPSEQQGSPNSAGSSQPQGGGQSGSNALSAPQASTEQEEADKANLEYARQQTSLVLERLEDQLAKKQVDQDLLKSLGWTEDELRRFVDRWKGLKEQAASNAQDPGTQRELDDALRSLGLRPQGQTRVRARAEADKFRDLNEGVRKSAPIEYAERVREFQKSIAEKQD